ncbi:MAG: lipopolysaccharide biosynthesis protein [Clostridium sp.]|uniref:lipopolysaccharide biosynthesis protein n=1 Tax=Clostridium sp. TaxID=1506 RepID=UPI003F2F23C1
MRVKNSLKNIYMSIITQVVIILLGFVSRKIFIDSLGTEYLGVNGLLTNLLSMLSLVEGGIGTSIVYNLYKPLAEGDKDKVISLVQLYKKLYALLAIIIFTLSLIIYPFLNVLMKDSSEVKFIGVVYFIFVFKNIISYLNAHKWSLINADQKGFVLAKYSLIFNVVTTISKITILIVTGNYILYLLIEASIFTLENIYNGKIVNRLYPYIKTKEKYAIDKGTKNNIVKNVKALFFHNIGTWCVFGTDNILISSFISISTVGIYSNYTMIVSQITALLGPIMSSIGASVGNLIATESEEKNYKIFKITYLVNFWIYSFAAIFLYNLLEPFINWWLGDGLLLDSGTFLVILINFYLTGLRSSVLMFKYKAGIFVNDKYVPLIESAINLIVSLILVKYMGLVGIFIGTTVSTISIPLWTQTNIVYKHVFKRSPKEYYSKYVLFVFITFITGTITSFVCSLIQDGTFISLILKGIVCVVITNLIYILLFYKTEEFKYLYNILSDLINTKFRKFLGVKEYEYKS